MNPEAMRTRARELHPVVMLDTVTVTRETLGDLDEETGDYPIVTVEVYAGRGRLIPTVTATVDAAGIAVDIARPVLVIPWTDEGVALPGDRVAVVGHPHDFEVYAEIVGTMSTARRYTLEEQA